MGSGLKLWAVYGVMGVWAALNVEWKSGEWVLMSSFLSKLCE